MQRNRSAAVVVALIAVTLATAAAAQVVQRSREVTNARAITEGMPAWHGGFTFCRLRYDRSRSLPSGLGWSTDYPAADINFLTRLSELTAVPMSRLDDGSPGIAAVGATDPDLFRCPFLFMSDPGSYDFSVEEIERMREFLLKGGFLWADDMWGDYAFAQLERNLRRILPEYPLVELDPGHRLFTSYFLVDEVPQIPSLNFWRRSGGRTSEFGWETDTPRLYALIDDDDRILVLVSHNTDFGDSWEREADEPRYFAEFSAGGYAVGVNVALWVLMGR
ncbi:MAG TPA: DUF4159 domain-containing protein [Longimicrobiales bacterium]|nr:DUF4159 domain-containing protein [Longimicrobiales bacterium]